MVLPSVRGMGPPAELVLEQELDLILGETLLPEQARMNQLETELLRVRALMEAGWSAHRTPQANQENKLLMQWRQEDHVNFRHEKDEMQE